MITGIKSAVSGALLICGLFAAFSLHSSNPDVFMVKIGSESMAQVEFAKLAARRAQRAEVRELASLMVNVHALNVMYLRDQARSRGSAFPPALDRDSRNQLDQLRSAPAEAFDRQYLDVLIASTEAVLPVFEAKASELRQDELQRYAFRNVVAVEEQLMMAKQIAQRQSTSL